MPKRFGPAVSIGLICTIALCFILLGCPGPSPPSGGEPPAQDESAAEDETSAESERETNGEEIPPFIEELVGRGQEELTQEYVEGVTAYGPFLFPGAELVPEGSTHQLHSDGTEIYSLQLGALVAVGTVADWYTDNLESGVTAATRGLPTGETLAHFEYQAPDESWMKIINVRGVPGEGRCIISVNLTRKAQPPEEENAAEGGSE